MAMQQNEHPIKGLMDTTLDKIRAMVDSNTIIGTPIHTADGTMIVPVSKMSFGFASGGSDFPSKTNKDLFGGGGGAGVSVTPVAFLVVKDEMCIRDRACIIAVNKWDAVEKDDKTMQAMRKKLENDFSFMSYAPIIFISAKTGQRVDRLFELIRYVDGQNALRVTTGMLNDLLARATARVQPPSDKGRRLKIYYMTQISVRPPTFVFFCNSKQLFHFSYQRYLENQIRETFGLEGTPVRIVIRERGEKA